LIKHASFSRKFHPISKFPSIARDIAIVVDDAVTWGMIEQALEKVSPLITSSALFDIFSSPKLGAGKKSVAFSLIFASEERTLESSEVDQVLHKVTKILKEKYNAVIR
jgi:phenylalanyl-tRNA synthetase beta chain